MRKTANDVRRTRVITHPRNPLSYEQIDRIVCTMIWEIYVPKDEKIDVNFARFINIITSLKSLAAIYFNNSYVRKFLRTLYPKWGAKVTAIEESKYFITFQMDELTSNIKVYEVTMEKDDEITKLNACRYLHMFL